MSKVAIKLVGCARYSYRDELFEKGNVYLLDEAKATVLLRSKDDSNRRFFERTDIDEALAPASTATNVTSDDAPNPALVQKKRGGPRGPRKGRVLTGGDTVPVDQEKAPTKAEVEAAKEVEAEEDELEQVNADDDDTALI